MWTEVEAVETPGCGPGESGCESRRSNRSDPNRSGSSAGRSASSAAGGVGSRPTRILARGAPHRRLGRVARHGTGPLRSRGDRAQACRSWERRRREPTVRGFDSLPARSARGTPSTAVDRPLRPGVVVKRYDQLRSKRPRSLPRPSIAAGGPGLSSNATVMRDRRAGIAIHAGPKPSPPAEHAFHHRGGPSSAPELAFHGRGSSPHAWCCS